METLKISRANALQAYKKADKNGKDMLSQLFGDQVKLSADITERVKTFEDVCMEKGVKSESYECVPSSTEDRYLQNFRKLLLIVEVLNEGWKPDFSNQTEYKYYPWLKYAAGSGFSYYVYGYDHTCSLVGSRLCYKSAELAKYAAKQFQDIYNQFFQPL
jgi:hypothetical protein